MRYTKESFRNCAKYGIAEPRVPYYRCYRPLVKRINSGYFENCYLNDDDYAESPYSYTRTFKTLQNELKELFSFVEPADNNRKTFSYRIQQLLIRVCIELETNFKAIMAENKYSRNDQWWNINDYWKINFSHKLSDYKVVMPQWEGKNKEFSPFSEWRISPKLSWYRAFQHTKHNRASKLYEANLGNLMNAFCGLFVVLTAQFKDENYSTGPVLMSVSSRNSYYGVNFGIGGMLQAIFPEWSEEEKYDVEWCDVCESSNRFRKFDYDSINDYTAQSR